jgi:uncharacterized protein (TIRG00374 family)
MKDKMKNILSFLMRLGFSGLLLWWLFSKIDTEKTIEILQTADLTYLYFAGGIFFICQSFLLVRWFIFIKALNLEARPMVVTRFFFIGLFGNLFLPSAIGGDLIKIIGLCKNSSQKPRVVASVLLDRLSGFASIVIVAVGSFIIGYRYVNEPQLIIPIAIIGVGSVVVAAILFNEKIYAFGCRIFSFFPKVQKSLMQMHYDIMLMQDNKMEGVKAIALSSVGQLVYAVTFWLSAKALHADTPLLYFFIFVPLICVASSLPSIGGLGVREAGAAYLLGKVGVASEVAVSISLISFLFMIMMGLLGGMIYVFTLSSGRVQHYSSDADVDPSTT